MSDQLREELAEVLAEHPPTETPYGPPYCPPCSEAIGDWVKWLPEHVADALLPVVARIKAEAKGEALREAAEELRRRSDPRAARAVENATWYLTHRDRAEASGREGESCPTEGCDGDARYAAPGRRHREGCRYPLWPLGQRGGL